MAMYLFNPISLPAPPPAAPGTDFADFATTQLASVDTNDSALIDAIASMTGFLQPSLDDLSSIGVLFTDAWTALDALLADADADDLTSYILAAIQTDDGLDSLSSSVINGISALPPDILDSIIGLLYDGLYSEIQAIAQSLIGPLEFEIERIEQIVSITSGWYPAGY